MLTILVERRKTNNNKTYRIMKKVIRLTESDLHRIVNASVRRVLREYESDDDGAYFKRNRKKHYGKGPDELYWDDDDDDSDELDSVL